MATELEVELRGLDDPSDEDAEDIMAALQEAGYDVRKVLELTDEDFPAVAWDG